MSVIVLRFLLIVHQALQHADVSRPREGVLLRSRHRFHATGDKKVPHPKYDGFDYYVIIRYCPSRFRELDARELICFFRAKYSSDRLSDGYPQNLFPLVRFHRQKYEHCLEGV